MRGLSGGKRHCFACLLNTLHGGTEAQVSPSHEVTEGRRSGSAAQSTSVLHESSGSTGQRCSPSFSIRPISKAIPKKIAKKRTRAKRTPRYICQDRNRLRSDCIGSISAFLLSPLLPFPTALRAVSPHRVCAQTLPDQTLCLHKKKQNKRRWKKVSHPAWKLLRFQEYGLPKQ